MKTGKRKNGWISPNEKMPALLHSVEYLTPTHRGLGYVDGTGRWMSFEGRVEPEPVVGWHEPKKGKPVYYH